ncbi:MAG: ABC transporter ATP-binding protein [Patescibacteria group bacterium]
MSIKIDNLKKTYSNGFEALKGVTFEIKENQIFGLLGANGAGKTTLLNILSGLVTKTEGEISVNGYSLEKDINNIKELFGIVPQEFNFNIFEKCEDIVFDQAGLYGLSRSEVADRLDFLFDNLGLAEKKKQASNSLSGGMKRRLMIARALIHKPKILILDEPTAGVDVELRHDMWTFLEKLQKSENLTVILTTHYLEEVERLCTDMVIVDKGVVVRSGKVQELIANLPKDNFVFTLNKAIPENVMPILTKTDKEFSYKAMLTKDDTLNKIILELDQLGIIVKSITPESSPVEQLFLQTVAKNNNINNFNYSK